MNPTDYLLGVGNLPVSITFREILSYSDDVDGAIAIPVTLKVGELSVRLLAKLDTGAEFRIFKREYGEELGLAIQDGELKRFITATGSSFDAYGHDVTMECFGREYDARFYFTAQYDFLRNVLGRTGWLEQFRIAIIHYDRQLCASHYDE